MNMTFHLVGNICGGVYCGGGIHGRGAASAVRIVLPRHEITMILLSHHCQVVVMGRPLSLRSTVAGVGIGVVSRKHSCLI